MKKYKYKLKGTGPIKFHLGYDFCDKEGVLCMSPKKFVDKRITSYKGFFEEKPR